MNAWFQLSLEVSEALSDPASGLLFELGCSGIQVEDGADAGRVRLTAYFPAQEDREGIEAALRAGLARMAGAGARRRESGRVAVDFAEVPAQDWTAAWRRHFRPVYPTPRIAICPPWERVPDPEGGFTVVIEPKMAFGTGHHETTRLALQMLAAAVRPGDRVLDVGTGSGILSIAAVRLGAGRAVGLDADAQALECARENLGLNGVEGRVALARGSAESITGAFEVVVANILSRVLVPMLPVLKDRLKPDGRLILGGVLAREEPAFTEAVKRAGLAVAGVRCEGEWVGVAATPGAGEGATCRSPVQELGKAAGRDAAAGGGDTSCKGRRV